MRRTILPGPLRFPNIATKRRPVGLILPHRFDRCVEPLSRVLDIGLISNHDGFGVGAPAVFDGRLGLESFPGARSTHCVDRRLPFGRGQPFSKKLAGIPGT